MTLPCPKWTPTGVVAALPFLRPLVQQVRESACRLSHLRLMARRRPEDAVAIAAVEDTEGEFVALLRDVRLIGVAFYCDYVHGVVLCPSRVLENGKYHVIYLVWREDREGPDAWVRRDELFDIGDLESVEREIPSRWWRVKMRPGRKRK